MIKRLSITVSLFFALATTKAQTPYTVTDEGSTRILNGLISKYIFFNDPSFSWYKPSSNQSSSNSPLTPALTNAPSDITFLIFGGTWCEDTQNILPKFFTYQQRANFPDNRITMVGVDRAKKSISNLATVFGITNVPTIIVLKNGKEVGRVIEYGKTGLWDKELSEMLN